MENRNLSGLAPDPPPRGSQGAPEVSALRSVAWQHARSHDDFEEIQQELWLRVLQSPNRSQAEIRWLAAIARNIAREIARGRHARTAREHRYARERATVTLPRIPEGIEREALVESLLRGLKHADQALLWCHFVDGMRIHELAASLELTPAATKARLHRSVVRLRESRAGTADAAAPLRAAPSSAG